MLQRWGNRTEGQPSPQRNSGALSKWPLCSWSPHWQGRSPWLLSLAGQPALGRVLVVPNFFNLRMMEATVFLGIFNAADIFWYPSPDLYLDTRFTLSFTTGGLQSSCRNISRMINGNRMHLSLILSLTAKGLNTCVHRYWFEFLIHLQTFLKTCWGIPLGYFV